jgi:prophage regulatory protein
MVNLPSRGVPMDRIITWKELRRLVPYCRQHIKRLEDAGQFPKRLRLGNGPRSRVGWLEPEVIAWQRKRIDERDTAARDLPA